MVNTSDLIEFASDPAFSLDNDMRVVGWNAGAEALLGYSQTETFGRPCSQVLQAFYPTGEPLCSVICEGRACISGGKKWGIGDCRIRHKNGEMITAGISSLVLPVESRKENSDDPIALIFLRKGTGAATETSLEMPMRIFALGHFGLAISGNGLNVDSWKRKKAALILKCLVSELDKPVHRERLIEWIWPNTDLESSWPRLKVTISYLRGVLREGGASANIIETVDQSYLLRRSSVWVDSDVFCTLVASGWDLLKTEKLSEALKHFEEAESLYRGDFFEDEPYAEWCTVERERLHEIYLEMLTGLAKCYTDMGRFMDASRICRLALSSDPCRENFIRILMESLVSLDRSDWARAHFIFWRRTLDQEYGLQPTEETLKAYRRYIGEDHSEI